MNLFQHTKRINTDFLGNMLAVCSILSIGMCFAIGIVTLSSFTLYYTTHFFDNLSLTLATCEVSHWLAQHLKRHIILAGEIASCLQRSALDAKLYQDILKLGILFRKIKWEMDCSLETQLMGTKQNEKRPYDFP